MLDVGARLERDALLEAAVAHDVVGAVDDDGKARVVVHRSERGLSGREGTSNSLYLQPSCLRVVAASSAPRGAPCAPWLSALLGEPLPRPVLTLLSVDLPVYVLSAATGESLRLQLVEEGAQDAARDAAQDDEDHVHLSRPQPWRINLPHSHFLAA